MHQENCIESMEEFRSTLRLKRKNTNRQVKCCICGKRLRSDNVKRHMRNHKSQDIPEIINNIHTKCFEGKIEKDGDDLGEDLEKRNENENNDLLEKRLLQNNELYKEKVKLGSEISNLIVKHSIIEQSLQKFDKEALDTYRKESLHFSLEHIELREWQKELIDLIKTPSDRQVIWIRGTKGNEGKTWFQKYVQSLYGCVRVAVLDLKGKTSDVLHALRKFPLSTVDIFFFNDSRSDDGNRNYSVLEHIKDGLATATKFNSDILRFRTPNIVVVFSNTSPVMRNLSNDRWKILYIQNNKLEFC